MAFNYDRAQNLHNELVAMYNRLLDLCETDEGKRLNGGEKPPLTQTARWLEQAVSRSSMFFHAMTDPGVR